MKTECCKITVCRENDDVVIKIRGKDIDGECCCTREKRAEEKRDSDCCK